MKGHLARWPARITRATIGGDKYISITPMYYYCKAQLYRESAIIALLVKNNYYESSTLTAKKGPMKTAVQNLSANSNRSVISWKPTFSLENALVYVEHRPGHSLGKK